MGIVPRRVSSSLERVSHVAPSPFHRKAAGIHPLRLVPGARQYLHRGRRRPFMRIRPQAEMSRSTMAPPQKQARQLMPARPTVLSRDAPSRRWYPPHVCILLATKAMSWMEDSAPGPAGRCGCERWHLFPGFFPPVLLLPAGCSVWLHGTVLSGDRRHTPDLPPPSGTSGVRPCRQPAGKGMAMFSAHSPQQHRHALRRTGRFRLFITARLLLHPQNSIGQIQDACGTGQHRHGPFPCGNRYAGGNGHRQERRRPPASDGQVQGSSPSHSILYKR